MGMTDKQFNAFLRMLISQLKEAEAQADVNPAKRAELMEKILDDLQKSLEA